MIKIRTARNMEKCSRGMENLKKYWDKGGNLCRERKRGEKICRFVMW